MQSRSVRPRPPSLSLHFSLWSSSLKNLCFSDPFLFFFFTASQEDGFSLGQVSWTLQLPPTPARDRNVQISQISEVQLLGSGPGQ